MGKKKKEKVKNKKEGISKKSHFKKKTPPPPVLIIYTQTVLYRYMYRIYRLCVGFVVMALYLSPFVVSLDCISSIALVHWSIRPLPSYIEWLQVSFVSGMIAGCKWQNRAKITDSDIIHFG